MSDLSGEQEAVTATRPTSGHATLEDVAARAGVSYQTVSRVVNGRPHVSARARQRVQEAIDALDYHPNHAARTLATRRTHMIEVIISGLDYYGPAQMVIGVEQAASAFGYRTVFSTVPERLRDGSITGAFRLDQRGIDGTLIVAPVQDALTEHSAELLHRAPIVWLGISAAGQMPSVVVDQRLGSYLATQHLIELGHRRIAEISGPLHWHDAAARHQSWLATLQEYGAEPVGSVGGDWTAESGYRAASQLLNGAPFTGLVVANDQMALGAIRRLYEAGVRVPDDVSVVGFDDTPESAYYLPPLTTIRQDFSLLGRQSVEYLMHLLAHPDAPIIQRVLPPQMIIRQSTCPTASHDGCGDDS